MGRTLAALLMTILVTGLSPAPAASQTGAQTPWGDPDLQGVWSYATVTPLERPAEVDASPAFVDVRRVGEERRGHQ